MTTWSTFRSLDMGQVGVAIFLGISALLGSTSRRRPVPWLVQRLRRLFPAYWLVMIVSFIVAWATGYKTFTPGQVVSQMLGLGLLTHPGSLVNWRRGSSRSSSYVTSASSSPGS